VNTLFLTTSLFNVMVDEGLDLGGVEQLSIAGEAASEVHVSRLRERYPEVRLVNG
jgi:hypothetical protein